jgi:hypothetical protein
LGSGENKKLTKATSQRVKISGIQLAPHWEVFRNGEEQEQVKAAGCVGRAEVLRGDLGPHSVGDMAVFLVVSKGDCSGGVWDGQGGWA